MPVCSILGANRHPARAPKATHGSRKIANVASAAAAQRREAHGEHMRWREQRVRRLRANHSAASTPDEAKASKASAEAPIVVPTTLEEALEVTGRLAPGEMEPETVQVACTLALSSGVSIPHASTVMKRLVEDQDLHCTTCDARKAALLAGSMALLKLVLRSSPNMQFRGLDVFDKRYPGQFKLNDNGRKNCLKALLARGAHLGAPTIVPASKLLHKIEADSFSAWVTRYFASLSAAGLAFPDPVEQRILSFLFAEPSMGRPE